MNLATTERKYKTLKTSVQGSHGPVKVIMRSGKLLAEAEEIAIHPDQAQANKLRDKASNAELRVAKELGILGFEHSVPMNGYFLDFYHRERRINIEIDGVQHLSRKDRDRKRDDTMLRLGIRVWRFKAGWAYNSPATLIDYISHLLNRPTR